MTPSSVVLVRAFIAHCKARSREDITDSASIPNLSTLASYMTANFTTLLALLDAEASGEHEEMEEWVEAQVFIVSELLKIAKEMDLTDEAGRRKVFSVARKFLVCIHKRAC